MNMAFGVGVFLAPVFIVALSYWLMRKTKNPYIAIGVGIVGLAVFFNFATYGPRYELAETKLPSPPDVPEFESGSKLIPDDDRWSHFDRVVKEHEDRQSN